MSWAFPLVFVGLCLSLVSMLVGCHMLLGGKGITKVCPFGYNLGVNTCSQVEFLVVCAYYYVEL